MNDQRSLTDQLRTLRRLAIQHRLYDADDWICGRWVDAPHERPAVSAGTDPQPTTRKEQAVTTKHEPATSTVDQSSCTTPGETAVRWWVVDHERDNAKLRGPFLHAETAGAVRAEIERRQPIDAESNLWIVYETEDSQ